MNDVLKLPNKILLRKFIIEFSYMTKRNNKRLRTVEIKSSSREDAEFWLYRWVEEYNKKNEFRAYDNVKILSYEEIDREVITI